MHFSKVKQWGNYKSRKQILYYGYMLTVHIPTIDNCFIQSSLMWTLNVNLTLTYNVIGQERERELQGRAV